MNANNSESPAISVVIPIFNEAPNVREVCRRVVETLEKTGKSFEIVAVDDGSRDETLAILREIQAGDNRLRVVRLLRNFGQTPALYAGFASVHGGIIVTLDADLQNPPEEIPKLLAKIEEGYDVVQGWREARQDAAPRRLASKLLNAMVSSLIQVRIKDLGCGLKAYRRAVVDQMVKFSHHSRYLPAEIVWLGVPVAEVNVSHNERAGGESKYGLFSLLRLSFDMIASVTTAPVKFVGGVGLVLSVVGFGMALFIAALRLIYGNWNDLATVCALFFMLAGVQMIATGLLCEYVSRIFIEVQGKPYYVIKEILE